VGDDEACTCTITLERKLGVDSNYISLRLTNGYLYKPYAIQTLRAFPPLVFSLDISFWTFSLPSSQLRAQRPTSGLSFASGMLCAHQVGVWLDRAEEEQKARKPTSLWETILAQIYKLNSRLLCWSFHFSNDHTFGHRIHASLVLGWMTPMPRESHWMQLVSIQKVCVLNWGWGWQKVFFNCLKTKKMF
jgi:hypothetical protein